MPQHVWTDSWVDRLRALIDKGKSGQQIADILTYEFRVKFTRNGVIGKTHRLGIRVKSVPGPRPHPRHKPKPKPPRAPRSRRSLPPTVIEPTPVLLDCRGLTLMELKGGLCAWPVADAPVRYCGLPCVGSYCPGHSAIAYERRPKVPRPYLWLEGGRHGRRG